MGPLAPEAVTTFDVDIPVLPGDRLALYTGDSPSPGKCFQVDKFAAGAELLGDVPVGGRKGSNGIKTGYRAPISAVVLPPPVVTGLSPIAWTVDRRDPGHDQRRKLRRVESVSFGAVTTTAFTKSPKPNSRSSRPRRPAGPVDVRVSTVAGESPASAADHFTYAAPPSTGPTGGAAVAPEPHPRKPHPRPHPLPLVQGAEAEGPEPEGREEGDPDRRLQGRKVTKADGVSAATGKVKTQRPKAGRSVAKGTKVAVKLG